MNLEEFHKQLADAPLSFRRKLRDYLRNPSERSACYITGYIAALGNVRLFKTRETVWYWLALIGRAERNDALARELLAEMDNPPADGAQATEIDALLAEVERLRREPHPAITHCDNCGCDWLDNGLNPVGCPYCKLSAETEASRRTPMKEVDFFSPGARLALELECLLLDTRNDAAQSRWWASAHEALEQWRQAVRTMEASIDAAQPEVSTTLEEAASHARVCSGLAEQHKGDAVLYAALTDAAAIIRDLLAERDALRELEERKQRDEALLRQALKALESGAWDTLRGRNAATAIRERLGEEE